MSAANIPVQVRGRREASLHCPPLECGHRDPLDCVAECPTEAVSAMADIESPVFDPSDVVQLWADAKSLFLAGNFPKYASPEWIALHPDDPRRLAAALAAAELWRKFGDEEALLAWFREASRARPSIADRRVRAELDEAAKPKRPHQLQATPGWPPIAIPGQPGRYLYARQEKAA